MRRRATAWVLVLGFLGVLRGRCFGGACADAGGPVFRILEQLEPYSVTLVVRAIRGQECGLLRMRS